MKDLHKKKKKLLVVRDLPERDVHHAAVHPVRTVDDIDGLFKVYGCLAIINADPDLVLLDVRIGGMLCLGRDRGGDKDMGVGLLHFVRDVVIAVRIPTGKDPGLAGDLPGHDGVPDDTGVFGLGHGAHDLLNDFREVAKHFIIGIIGIGLHGLLVSVSGSLFFLQFLFSRTPQPPAPDLPGCTRWPPGVHRESGVRGTGQLPQIVLARS